MTSKKIDVENWSYKSLLTTLFFLLIAIVAILKLTNSKVVKAGWFNDSWMYRKAVSITNSSGSNLADFQVSLSIGTSALINAGKMQSDCDDIRITDQNGKLLNFWIEVNGNFACNKDSTKIWAKITSLPSSGASVFVYYGNPSATSVQNGDQVFEFFEDFTDAARVTQKFDKTTNVAFNYSISNSLIHIDGNYHHYHGLISKNDVGLNGNDYIVEYYSPYATGDAAKVALWAEGSPSNGNWRVNDTYPFLALMHISNQTNTYTWTPANTATSSFTYVDSVWTNYLKYHFHRDDSTGTNGYIKYLELRQTPDHATNYADSRQITAKKEAGNTQFYGNKIAILGENNEVDFDWVRVRKYASTDPTSALQTEEVGTGPVAYWKFDEGVGSTAYDSTSSRNNGVISGAAWTTEDLCLSGKCLTFDGSNDYASMSNSSPELSTGNFTISLWAYFGNTAGQWQRLVGKKGISGANAGYSIYWGGDTGKLMWSTANGSTGNEYWTTQAFTRNTWHHIVMVRNSSDSRVGYFYVDGTRYEISTIPSMLDVSSPAQNFSVGALPNGTLPFQGKIDEVKVYPYARTAAQIKSDYAAGKAHASTNKGTSANLGSNNKNGDFLSNGLVGYWKMDENIGTTTADSSGNNNTGTFGAGNSAPAWSSGKFGVGTSFDGVNDYIQIGNTFPDDQTISAWIKTTDGAGSTHWQTKAIAHQENSGSANDWGFGINSGGKLVYGNGDGASDYTITGNTTINDGYWHFVTATRKKNTGEIIIYVDGNKDGNGTGSTNSLTAANVSGNGVQIGRSGDASPVGYLNGNIDELRIYNRALSLSEVEDLYNWAPGPVGYWDFNEKTGSLVNDKSGIGNSGSWNGTLGSQWSVGKYGGAGKFNGSDNYINAGNGTSLNITNSITVEGWVKPNIVNDWKRFVSRGEYSSGWILGITNTGKPDITAQIQGGSFVAMYGLTTLQIGQWYHIVGVIDSSTQKISIYLNGKLDNTPLNFVGSIANPGISNSIGKSSAGYYFNGSIDEVKIYNYARSAKQIVEDMNAGHPAGGSPVGSQVGYWKFDEGYGTIANNFGFGGSTLNGTFGTGNSAPTWTNDGKYQKALSFDGINDYIQGSSLSSLKPSNITISAWAKTSDSKSTQFIGGYGNTGVLGYWLGAGSSKFVFMVGNGSSTIQLSSNFTSTDNIWHHIVGTYDGTTQKIFIDGVLRNSATTVTGDISYGSLANGFLIGNIEGFNSARFWNGSIDEVKIYNYALTADEIKIDYNRNSALQMGSLSSGTGNTAPSTAASQEYCVPGDTINCSSPVVEYKFEEGIGTTAYDTSGNNNSGVWQGTLGNQWSQGKIGKAGNFNGINNYTLGTNNLGISGNAEFTMCAWIKYTGTSLPTEFASFMGNNSTGTTNQGMSFTFYQGRPALDFWVNRWRATNALSLNTWYYICGTKTAGTISTTSKIYVNGQLVPGAVEGTDTTPNITDSPPVTGRLDGTRWFQGLVDQAKYYNYARTPAQIAWDYNRGSPIGWWKFDECQGNIAYDSSGIGNTGAISIGASGTQNSLGTCQVGTSAAWTNGAIGKLNSSLNFDGTDDEVSIGSFGILNNYTISFWAKHNVAGKMPIGSRSGTTYYWYGDNSWKYTHGGVSGEFYYPKSVSIPYGTWGHFTVTYDGINVRIYRNGVFEGFQASTGTADFSNGFYLGWGYPNSSYHFNGQIDDVRIYNYALTPTQVKILYNGGAVSFN